ncbi:uncharacterized protein BDZ99DRAFT_568892 [Mytilinidion resinicola]|uniref:Uncharacterized protein n=1 Tax=Mytilinidion resinicola TaxID=574789 RepID=A0A6A6YTA3_9PEZI|nr:uncharacterized protein BDZ99DRAFT_568892 [Mytilinidion resinicola]KAF2812152.1 hypothetical protein BDZ99DRAFT_568892 [Mytilinidion resinicola]
MTAPIPTRESTTPPVDIEEHVFRPLTPEDDTFALRMFNAYQDPAFASQRANPSARLAAPDSFHALTHHLSLYILALRHDEPQLAAAAYAQIVDYYARTGHSASPFRLEYVYDHTEGPNKLRAYLAESAAARLVSCGGKSGNASRSSFVGMGGVQVVVGPEVAVSKSMRDVVAKGGDLAVDLFAAVVKLSVDAK